MITQATDDDRSHTSFSWSCLIISALALVLCSCANRVPEPTGVAPGMPHISWVFMSGDRDAPDRDFACQSDPRSDCVIPATRPDNQVFADLHFYYHGAGPETKYTGSIQISFLEESPEAHTVPVSVTVKKNESIRNESVMGIVTSTPGTYSVAFDLAATSTNATMNQPIRQQVTVVVK